MNNQLTNFNGHEISKDAEGRISLTALWKSAGANAFKKPADWTRKDGAEYIATVGKELNMPTGHIFKNTRGRNGGSFAVKEVALQYAKYLSPKLALFVNQAFFERIEEEKNPELIVERAVKSFRRKGLTDAQISARIQGVQARNKLTEVCGKHGVRDAGFRDVTNAIYMPLLGGTAADVRKSLGLPVKANLRDNMSVIELRTVELAELVSADNIQAKRVFGAQACVDECYKAAAEIGGALLRSRR